MEPTPYIFTPNQWGILQSLVDETGMDIRGVITRALHTFADELHGHDKQLQNLSAEARRQSLLVSSRASESEALDFIEDHAAAPS